MTMVEIFRERTLSAFQGIMALQASSKKPNNSHLAGTGPYLSAAIPALAAWTFSSLMGMRRQTGSVLEATERLILLPHKHGTVPNPYEVWYIQLWNDLARPTR